MTIALLKAGDGHLGELKERLWRRLYLRCRNGARSCETLIIGVLAGMFDVLLAFMAIRYSKRTADG